MDRTRHPVKWQATDDAEFPYAADIDGQHWVVRVNDFPAEPIYTLIVDGSEAGDLDAWPAAWIRPAPR